MYIGTMNNPARNCASCGKTIRGRSDKKFCDDYCRNSYNNSVNSDTSTLIRNVNNILRRNRRIMQEVIPDGEVLVKLPKAKLSSLGFSFQYFTHLYTTKKGGTYHFCYEFGYLVLESDWMLVVKKKEAAQ